MKRNILATIVLGGFLACLGLVASPAHADGTTTVTFTLLPAPITMPFFSNRVATIQDVERANATNHVDMTRVQVGNVITISVA
jgi:hypothetical protein